MSGHPKDPSGKGSEKDGSVYPGLNFRLFLYSRAAPVQSRSELRTVGDILDAAPVTMEGRRAHCN